MVDERISLPTSLLLPINIIVHLLYYDCSIFYCIYYIHYIMVYIITVYNLVLTIIFSLPYFSAYHPFFCLCFLTSEFFDSSPESLLFLITFLILTWGYVYCSCRERGREGEGRETERVNREREGEKHWSVASHTHPDRWRNLQPRNGPWPGIQAATFWHMGQCSNQLGYQAGAHDIFF